MMLTESQLETAAREYCRLAGTDPEAKVVTSPPPNADGTVYAVCIWVPAWRKVASMLAQQDLVRHCIDFSKQENAK